MRIAAFNTSLVLFHLSFVGTHHHFFAMDYFSRDYMEWIWRSSMTRQKCKKWPQFTQNVYNLWAKAFDDARAYALTNGHVLPEMVVNKQPLKQGRSYRKVGFLKPGTIVWAILNTHPVCLHWLNFSMTAEHGSVFACGFSFLSRPFSLFFSQFF